MEINRRAKCSPSGDKFTFPVITNPNSDVEFEFGNVTSPASPNSPADHLFSNGKLRPHSFPVQTPNTFSFSRSTSRASSIGSKDSLMSSRSNSTNSRSSTSTSARTSTSEAAPERRLPAPSDHYGAGRKERINMINARPGGMSCQYQYGSARRWQLIAAAPALKQQRVRPRRADRDGVDDRKAARKLRGGDEGKKSWFKRNILKSFVSVCQEIHAIKT